MTLLNCPHCAIVVVVALLMIGFALAELPT
jgi:hypothetical protein